MISETGLQEYMVAVTVARERPDLEAEKNQLTAQAAENLKYNHLYNTLLLININLGMQKPTRD